MKALLKKKDAETAKEDRLSFVYTPTICFVRCDQIDTVWIICIEFGVVSHNRNILVVVFPFDFLT